MSTIPTIVNTTTTSTSVTSGVATIGLSAKPNAAVGDAIIISGVIPTAYNGKFTVTAVSNVAPFSVSFVAPTGASGPQTRAGSFTRSTYSSTVATTAASTQTDTSSGRIFATVQLASLLNVAVGDTIIVKGVTPSGYNSATSTVGGVTTTTPWTVTGASSTPPYSVTYLVNSTLGPQTNAGTVALAVPKTSFYTGDFSPVGATIGALGGFTQNVIEEALKSDFLGSSGWFPLIEQLWEGLDQALALPIAIIKKILETLILGPLDNIVDSIAGLLGLPEVDIDTVDGVIETLGAVGEWLFSGVNDLLDFFKDPVDGILNIGKAILTLLFGTFDATKSFLENLITKLLGSAGDTVAFFTAFVTKFIHWITNNTNNFLTQLVTALIGTATNAAAFFKSLIDQLIRFITNDLPGAIAEAGGIFTAICNKILNGTLIQGLLGKFASGTTLQNIIDMVGSFIGLLGTTLGNGVTQIVQFLQNVINWIWNAFSYFTGGLTNQSGKTIADVITLFTDWINGIMGGLSLAAGSFIGQIVSRITGVAYGAITDPLALLESFFSGLNNGVGTLANQVLGGVAAMFGQTIEGLSAWAIGLITSSNLYKAVSAIWPQLIAVIPIANINQPQEKVNLLNLGAFATSSSLEASNGWSWDSSSNRTGNIGGAAKLNCAASSGNRYLYSNQNVKVSPGDRIAASAYMKSTSFNGNSASIAIAVIPFVGTSQQSAITLASRGGSTAWVEFGSEITAPGGGVNLIWEVPKSTNAQVTSVQMVLVVNSSATTGSVYFDDLILYKTGLLKQGSTENLLSAFGGVHDGLRGYTPGTTTLAEATQTNMFTAASSAQGLANTANNNATGAVGAANAAAGVASGAAGVAGEAKGNTQIVVDNIAQTVGGIAGATGSAPATVSTNFQSFFNKLYGANTPQNTVPQGKITELTGAFGGVKDALARNNRGTTPTTTLDYASFFDTTTATTGLITTIDTRVTTTNSAVFGAGTTVTPGVSQLRPEVIPDELNYTEGSGAFVRNTTPGSVSVNAGQNRLGGLSVWNVRDENTADIRVRPAVDSGAFNFMQVNYAGWYMAEICYGLNAANVSPYGGGTTTLPYSFNIAPVLYAGQFSTGMSPVAIGQDAMQVYWATSGNFAWSQRYAHSSFIVYLRQGWYVAPGYDLKLPNDAGGNARSSANILRADGSGKDFFFALSLLNKSLA